MQHIPPKMHNIPAQRQLHNGNALNNKNNPTKLQQIIPKIDDRISQRLRPTSNNPTTAIVQFMIILLCLYFCEIYVNINVGEMGRGQWVRGMNSSH